MFQSYCYRYVCRTIAFVELILYLWNLLLVKFISFNVYISVGWLLEIINYNYAVFRDWIWSNHFCRCLIFLRWTVDYYFHLWWSNKESMVSKDYLIMHTTIFRVWMNLSHILYSSQLKYSGILPVIVKWFFRQMKWCYFFDCV